MLHSSSITFPAYFLDRHLGDGFGNRVAVRADRESATFDQLHRQSWQIARALRAYGVKSGDRVAFILQDSVFYVAAIFAVARLGAIAVPISTRLIAENYLEIWQKCRPCAVILDEDQMSLAEAAAGRVPSQLRFFSTTDVSLRNGVEALLPAVAAMSPSPLNVRLDPANPALIQFTSGSTGRPKGVVHCHDNIVAIRKTYSERLGLRAADVCYSTAKLSFGYGFGNSVLLPFAAGAGAILDGRLPNPTTVIDLIEKQRPTAFFATPGVYAGLLRVGGDSITSTMSSVRLCVSAGEQLGALLSDKWKRHTGHDLLDGIGSTECLHIFISTIPGRRRENSVGELVPHCHARILNESEQPVSNGVPGELWLRSPCNSRGYWDDSEATARVMRDGWVRTGDVFSRDGDGFFFYRGRVDEIVKVGGQKVFPREVEECLMRLPGVRECCVAGVETKDGLLSLNAYTVLERDYPSGLDAEIALKRSLATLLPPHKVPARIVFVEDLPRSPTGKLDRKGLAGGLSGDPK